MGIKKNSFTRAFVDRCGVSGIQSRALEIRLPYAGPLDVVVVGNSVHLEET